MFKEVVSAIEKSEKILIYPHKSVDGDCLGSAYALKLALLKTGRLAQVEYEPNEADNRIMKVIRDVEVAEFEPDLIIAVDCGDADRMGTRAERFLKFENTVNIDHHGTNVGYAKVNYVDGKAAAAGEIIYDLLKYMNISIDDDIANNLYVAISSDTGGFAYSNTTHHTHSIAGELIGFDIDFPAINAYLFRTKTYRELMLAKEALDTMEVLADGKVASVTITKEVVDKYDAKDSELGGLVDYPRSLDTVMIALYFKEIDGGVKVSMRSTGTDVSAIAVKHGGGGHIRASGCTINKPLCEVKKMIYDDVLSEVNNA